MDEQTSGYFEAQEILDAPDFTEEDIIIPEWGGKAIRIRSTSKDDQKRIRDAARYKDDDGDERFDQDKIEMGMFIECVVRPKFTAAQIAQLRKKQSGVIDRILKRVTEISGISPSLETSKKAVGQATKSPAP